MAAVELIRSRPNMADRMMATLVEQPPKIAGVLSKFSSDVETALRITKS